MCGIAGILTGDISRATEKIGPMVDMLRHRGPNDSGTHISSLSDISIALGHTRLSVIDTSTRGHQPMIDIKTGCVLIYNGELYNYKSIKKDLERAGIHFDSNTDTEVLLKALALRGPEVISNFEGMYAFAFLDPRRNSLLLARDPLGIKPLYLTRKGNNIIFASEVRALFKSGMLDTQVDQQALNGFLAYGAVQAPNTLFRDATSFPAGCFQEFIIDAGMIKPLALNRFWQFPTPEPKNDKELIESLPSLLESSVRSHLVSDVPIGVFLSSGIDSTVIASLAAKYTSELRTYTVRMEQAEIDESRIALQTSERLGSLHYAITIQPDEALAMAHKWFADMDMPSMDGLNVYIISKVVRSTGTIVALSGQGGDELFGGYPSFKDIPRWRRWTRLSRLLPKSGRNIAAALMSGMLNESEKQKLQDLLSSSATIKDLFFLKRRTLSNAQMSALGVDVNESIQNSFVSAQEFGIDIPTDIIAAISILESHFYMGNMLLRDSDVFGMANSLEIRVPFLDKKVIDTVYRISGRGRMPSGSAKNILKQHFGKYLKEEQLTQPKKGFVLPIAKWMQTSLRDTCEESLKYLSSTGILAPKGIDLIWQAFIQEPNTQIWSRAWQLCALGMYLRNTKDLMTCKIT